MILLRQSKFLILVGLLVCQFTINGQDYRHLENDYIRFLSNSFESEGLIRVKHTGSNLYGFIDTLGAIVIPFEYEYTQSFSEGLAVVKKKGKYGYINKKNEVIIPLVYDYASSILNDKAVVIDGRSYGVIDRNNRIIIPIEYDKLDSGANKTFAYFKNDTIGLIINNEVIPLDSVHNGFTFNSVTINSNVKHEKNREDIFCVQKGKEWNFIGGKGELLHGGYSNIIKMSFGTAMANKDGKYYFIRKDGSVDESIFYDRVQRFRDKRCAVKSNGKWGYIDQDNIMVIPCMYDSANRFKGGIAVITIDSKAGLIDTFGEELIHPKYDKIELIPRRFIATMINDSMIYYNWDFIQISKDPYNYLRLWEVQHNLIKVKKDKYFGYINGRGNIVIEAKFESIGKFKSGLAKFKQNGKWGLIDTTGTVILSSKYDELTSGSNGVNYLTYGDSCAAFQEGKFLFKDVQGKIFEVQGQYVVIHDGTNLGLVNLNGERLLAVEYGLISKNSFGPGFKIMKDSKYGLYTPELKSFILPVEYEDLDVFYNSVIIYKKDNQYGLMNLDLEIIITNEYDLIDAMTYGLLVKDQDKYGLANKEGVWLHKPVFDSFEYIGNRKAKVVRDGKTSIISWNRDK